MGDNITLASGTLAPKGDATLAVGNGVSATLQAAAKHDVPVAHAAVPTTVSTCSGELLLNGSPSTTTSVFPLSYRWEVSACTCTFTCTCTCMTCTCTCNMHVHILQLHVPVHAHLHVHVHVHVLVRDRAASGRLCMRKCVYV